MCSKDLQYFIIQRGFSSESFTEVPPSIYAKKHSTFFHQKQKVFFSWYHFLKIFVLKKSTKIVQSQYKCWVRVYVKYYIYLTFHSHMNILSWIFPWYKSLYTILYYLGLLFSGEWKDYYFHFTTYFMELLQNSPLIFQNTLIFQQLFWSSKTLSFKLQNWKKIQITKTFIKFLSCL